MNNQDNNTITISKEFILKMGGVVILPLEEYNKLCEKALMIETGLKKKAEKKKK